jgi:pyridoxal phosphate enzyme (YggS family)
MTAVDAARVAANVTAVRARIDAAGGRDRTRLVAVTKGFGSDAVRAAIDAGVIDIGENYAQELERKAADLAGTRARWHFIGRVQRNKVRGLAPLVHLWQAVDRVAVGREIARHQPGAAVLVQVNVSAEPQQGGCAPEAAAALVAALRADGLDVRGLMAIGRAGGHDVVRPGFRMLNRLADELGVVERSMGMSDDFVVAVEEGSTLVRIGRGLFGDRP